MQPVRRLSRWLAYLLSSALGLGPVLATAQEFRSYYVADVVGSPVLSADAYANVRWTEDYRPYGERVSHASAGSNDGDNERWFAGAPQNDVTGLTDLGHRFYDPVVGRFLSIDPVATSPADGSNFNRYSYANNNPYKFIDPHGEVVWIPIVVGVLWIGDKGFAAYEAYQDVKAIRSGEATIGEVLLRRGAEHAGGMVAGLLGRLVVKGGKRFFGNASHLNGGRSAGAAFNTTFHYSQAQLQAKFKHAHQFGVTRNWGKGAAEEFQAALEKHIHDPDTVAIFGTYRGGSVDVTHFFNQKTGLNVMRDENGNFLSGWKLDDQQLKDLITKGDIR
jgi:RHS repeat-associated protein